MSKKPAAAPTAATPAAPAEEKSAAASADDDAAASQQPEGGATMGRAVLPPSASTSDVPSGDDGSSGGDAPLYAPIVFLQIEAPSGKSVKVETTPSDSVLDVRQFLLECPETAEYTSYHLEASFGPLNDYAELQRYPQLCTPSQAGQPVPLLKIVPDLYDERAARLHVRRLRELLVKPPAHVNPSAVQTGYENVAPGSQEEKALVATSASSAANKKKKNKGKANDDDIFKEFASTSASSSSSTTSTDTFSLHSYFSPSTLRLQEIAQNTLVDCVKNVGFSGWNPPPGNRRLQGDLLYLEISTFEGNQLHVTANQEGFFVNQSTHLQFNPEPAASPYKSLTLVELLRKTSPAFQMKYTRACQRKINQHPFEAMELAPASNAISHSWLAQAKKHTYDWNRSEDALLNTFGMDNRGISRDFNEELQSSRELPKATVGERIERDRTMYRVYSDFVDAATKGAVAVVHGHIPPVNPTDNPRSWVFIYNNIFFSFAVDAKDLNENGTGSGDRVSYQMANQDLHGVKAYSALDIDDLYTLSTVLVDYRGFRVIAQSIIPGIFHGDRASKHVYGSMNNGETIEANPAFHALMLKAAEKLHIKPHEVKDKKGEAVTLATCLESKGIIGSDGRNYILDLLRAFPRDANYVAAVAKDGAAGGRQPSSCLLRPELIEIYCHSKSLIAALPSAEDQEKAEEARREVVKKKIAAAEEEAQKKKGSDPLTEEEKAQVSDPILEADADEQRAEIEAKYNAHLSTYKFNPDAFTNVTIGGTDEERQKDEAFLRELADYLKKDQLQKLMKQLRGLDISPVDTQHLTAILHENGINMRYLSSIISLAHEMHLPHIENLAIQECIVRSAKHLFNGFLRNITPEKSRSAPKNAAHVNSIDNLYFAPLIAKFLNSMFGTQAMGHKVSDEASKAAETVIKALKEEEEAERKELAAREAAAAAGEDVPAVEEKQNSARNMEIRFADGSRAPTDPLSPANLWTLIRQTVAEKFNYNLPAYLPMTARSKLCMLRSFCQKTGVQLQAKDYDLAPNSKNTVPFTVVDILDLFPVVKAHMPVSNEAKELLESGKTFMQQGQFQIAYQLLNESLNLHHQVYGPMHVDTADVYSALAYTCFAVRDVEQAIDFQQRAIIILERVQGLDHYQTAHAHMLQALYCNERELPHSCMKHMQRALFLFELIAGNNHPDTASAHMNMSYLLLQQDGKLQPGLKHAEAALERNQLALGPEHVHVGLSHHAVAVAHALLGDFRASVNNEKMTKSIFLTAVGPKSNLVVRTQLWLDHFTSLAVKLQQSQNRGAPDAPSGRNKKGAIAKQLASEKELAAQTASLLTNIPMQLVVPPQLQGLVPPLNWVSLYSGSAPKGGKVSLELATILESRATASRMRALRAAQAASAEAAAKAKEAEDAQKAADAVAAPATASA